MKKNALTWFDTMRKMKATGKNTLENAGKKRLPLFSFYGCMDDREKFKIISRWGLRW